MNDEDVCMTMWMYMALTGHIKMGKVYKSYVCITTIEKLKKDRVKDFSTKELFMKYLIN